MADPGDPDVASTLGALLVGGSIALVLSGVVSVQCIIYYKLYPTDVRIRTFMVLTVWVLDVLHSAFIVASLFDYFIHFFGDTGRIDYIPPSIALSVVVTAIQTLIVHYYFAHKIFKSSGKNWWITGPIVILAFLRVLAASVSTTEMILLKHYSVFTHHYPGWVFTTGLSLSASVDIIITGWLCYFLQKMRRRTSSTPMARMVDTLTLYTLENGLVTCVATTASLICWLRMPKNLVFLGLHFIIGKLYANSLLISLNTRKELREMRWTHTEHPSGSAWPVLGGGELTSPYSAGHSYGGGVYTYGYGAVGEISMSTPTSAYRPAFKVAAPTAVPRVQPPDGGVRVRSVRRASDDLSVSDVSRDEYTYTANVVGERRRRPRSPRLTADHLRALP